METIIESAFALLAIGGIFYFLSESQFAEDARLGARVRKARERKEEVSA